MAVSRFSRTNEFRAFECAPKLLIYTAFASPSYPDTLNHLRSTIAKLAGACRCRHRRRVPYGTVYVRIRCTPSPSFNALSLRSPENAFSVDNILGLKVTANFSVRIAAESLRQRFYARQPVSEKRVKRVKQRRRNIRTGHA